MTTQKTLLTAEEFYLFCCQNDGWYELVEGEVVELAPRMTSTEAQPSMWAPRSISTPGGAV